MKTADMKAPPVMLIAGGTGSIGMEIARQALAEGWAVVVQGRSQDSVAASVRTLEQLGERDPHLFQPQVCGVVSDIRDHDAIATLVARAADCYGRLDAVIDCLVTGPDEGVVVGAFEGTTPEAYAGLAELSIVYLQRLAHATLPWLKQSRGCLIAFASDAGLFAARGQTLIATLRAATVGFVRNLALDVSRDGVRVHCISPGFVENTRTAEKLAASRSSRLEQARKRAGLGLPTPADIAPAVLFLCSDGARKMTGQILSINGGLNA